MRHIGILLFVVGLAVVFPACGHEKTVPEMGVEGEAWSGPESTPPASLKYEPLLLKYMANIDEMAKRRQARQIKDFQKAQTEMRYWLKFRAGGLEFNPERILAKLRVARRANPKEPLNYEGEWDENSIYPYLVGYSPDSAKLVITLHKEGAFRDLRETILQRLDLPWGKPSLCKEYAEFIDGLIASTPKDSEQRPRLMAKLYSHGIFREKYHAELQRYAVETDNPYALPALFFDTDPQTGQRVARISRGNLDLLKKLSDKSRHPEIRLDCARYALLVHDYDLAQRICEELLAQRYKGMDDAGRKTPDEDYSLHHARREVMLLMFYGLRNERMFKIVFDRATVPPPPPIPAEFINGPRTATQPAPPQPVRRFVLGRHYKALAYFKWRTLGKWEVEQAQSLIKKVQNRNRETCNQQGKIGPIKKGVQT